MSKKKKPGPSTLIVIGQHQLNERRLKVWIPFLQGRVRELEARVEEKQVSGS